VPTAAILLAPGGSRRLGRPKQLLELSGEPLVRRAAETALASRCEKIFVVVGASGDEVSDALVGLDVAVVSNPAWETGMGSSIAAGVGAVASDAAGFQGVLLLLCDQPRLTPSTLNALLEAGERAAEGIAACAYADTVGVPAFFSRAHWPALSLLPGDRGAKSLLLQHENALHRVPCPAAQVDIDTQADYDALTARETERRPGKEGRGEGSIE
jgi:molybdenum cofactor cytidylyltransferase